MIKIKNKTLEIPIIQGGMGVGISLSSLAGNVMKQGGMGVLSAAHPGYGYEGFEKNPLEVNVQAIIEEAKKARIISQGRGLLGINIMVAGKQYDQFVKAAIDAKVDVIISGAGLPLELANLVGDHDIAIAPIVSSGKAIKLICRAWDTRYGKTPDFVVIEGAEAGGHLGFKLKDLEEKNCQTLEEILIDVKKEIQPYIEKYERAIPIFVAGGIYTGADIARFIKLGADGVQMGTRFICTEECDAALEFKQQVVASTEEQIKLVYSPTGFPGRAVITPIMEKVQRGEKIPVRHCFNCLTPCKPAETKYCISTALIKAAKGDIENGLVFVGSNAHRIKEITTVEKLIKELLLEMKENREA